MYENIQRPERITEKPSHIHAKITQALRATCFERFVFRTIVPRLTISRDRKSGPNPHRSTWKQSAKFPTPHANKPNRFSANRRHVCNAKSS